MKRFGPIKMNKIKMNPDDIFLLRLNLMIVMIKASLSGYPLGEYRKKAVLNNVSTLHKMIPDQDVSNYRLDVPAYLFKERVKLLCIMATAIACDDYPLGIHRREAILDNIDVLCRHIFPNKDLKAFHEILKVA